MPQMSPLSARYLIGFYDMEQIYMYLLYDVAAILNYSSVFKGCYGKPMEQML